MRVGLVITTYDRVGLTLSSFSKVVGDPRLVEVVISDDHSNYALFSSLANLALQWRKVGVHRNAGNLGSYLNKHRAVALSTAPWVILLDSDNRIEPLYLDTLFALKEWNPDTLYIPTFGAPSLNYRAYEGTIVTQHNVSMLVDRPQFSMALNTGNFFVQREAYLEVFDETFEPLAADSLYFAYCWLSSGRRILFTPGLQYHHLVHEGYWMQNAEQSAEIARGLVQKMREWTCVV